MSLASIKSHLEVPGQASTADLTRHSRPTFCLQRPYRYFHLNIELQTLVESKSRLARPESTLNRGLSTNGWNVLLNLAISSSFSRKTPSPGILQACPIHSQYTAHAFLHCLLYIINDEEAKEKSILDRNAKNGLSNLSFLSILFTSLKLYEQHCSQMSHCRRICLWQLASRLL